MNNRNRYLLYIGTRLGIVMVLTVTAYVYATYATIITTLLIPEYTVIHQLISILT